MTSARKILANRTNAAASTGPKTTEGKARAARNARRHGLSVPVFSDPHWSEEVEKLAQLFLLGNADPACREFARRAAAAQIDVMRIRTLRRQMIQGALNGREFSTARTKMIRARIMLAGAELPRDSVARLMAESNKEPSADEKYACVFAELSATLSRLDRYERRALSRRRKAIRDFDRIRKRKTAKLTVEAIFTRKIYQKQPDGN